MLRTDKEIWLYTQQSWNVFGKILRLGYVNNGIPWDVSILGYVNNDAKRFKIFENRIQLYLKNIDVRQWIHAKSNSNPANYISREL